MTSPHALSDMEPSIESQQCIQLQSPTLKTSIDQLLAVVGSSQSTHQSINDLQSPFHNLNQSIDDLISRTDVEETIGNATEILRRDSTINQSINQSINQMNSSFTEWSNAELEDLLHGTNQTSYYQSVDQSTNQSTNGQLPHISKSLLINQSINDLKQVINHPVQQISLTNQSINRRTFTTKMKHHIGLSIKQSINRPKSMEETKEQQFDVVHTKAAPTPFVKSMFYDPDTSTDQPINQSIKRNPRVNYVNISHSQSINQRLKTRSQREHDALIDDMLAAASVGAGETAKLKKQNLVE